MQLTIKLVAAADDQPEKSPSIQKEYQNFRSTLNDAGIKFSQRAMAFDSATALGFPLGEFIIEFTTTVLPVISTAVGGWFYARKDRKIRLEFNGVVFEASSIKEMEKLIKLYEAARDGRPYDPDSHRNTTDPDSGR
ncbi:hypothetical protein [Pseudomonas protegens]|uniref:hypothetical protein n=1 Tax=Pseudomonas protegens TaxID=380021 RepID=UPI001E3174DE|nr:hypothetical protein [Pseudomonas protegens]MCD9569440.1 hypothetical protein [Pseudomonas protegens]